MGGGEIWKVKKKLSVEGDLLPRQEVGEGECGMHLRKKEVSERETYSFGRRILRVRVGCIWFGSGAKGPGPW